MKIEELAHLALDHFDVMCYIVDIDTFELVYVNELARRTFAPFSPTFEQGKKCYDFLHDKSSVCEICNIKLLQEGQRLYTEVQNERNKKFYSHVDSIVQYQGKRLKLTLAFDATEQKAEIESLTRIISIEETLIKCVQTLSEDIDFDSAIMKLLSIVCQYYDADRAYLFEVNPHSYTAQNTYEWCIRPELNSIDEVPILKQEELLPIMQAFNEYGEYYIADIYKDLDHDSPLFKILDATSCKSIQLVPLRVNNEITYFMGVDNPRRSTKDLTLLHSVIIFVADDVKKNKIFKQLEHLSYTDVLTGLNNRNKYLERLEELDIKKLSSLGYVHVNVNALKRMNELYGEQYGDAILKQVACILRKHILVDLFRVSGDEFIALCPNISQAKFELLIEKLRKEEQSGTEFSFAVGGVWQDKKIDIRQGLTQASDIMYSDKQNYYKAQVTDRVQSRLNPVEIILEEIRDGLFTVYYQPKVNLSTGEIASAEALVRKISLDGKIIPPDRFVPIYENESTIRHLDFFVLEEICKLLQYLIAKDNPLPIAVNFSRVTFISYDVIDEIVKTCSKYQVPHKYVKIELTESMDKMDFEFFHRKIAQMKELGFEISLDDFGAKQSNLLMLTMAEFSEVKIDKGLVDNITTSAENRTVVRNIIKTIKELGKSACVAEGIETLEQMNLLKDFGCTYGQGYFFYRPMSQQSFLEVYESNIIVAEKLVQAFANPTRRNFVVNYDELYSCIDAMPLCMNLWNHKRDNIMCNDYAVQLFKLNNKEEYLEKFFMLSPEIQPDGRNSAEAAFSYINEARNKGWVKFNWMHQTLEREEIPSEITLVRLEVKSEDGDYLIAGYTRDLRPQLAGTDEAGWVSEYFFNEVSDKTLFNSISEIAAEFFWVYNNRLKTIQFYGKGREILDLPTRKMDFPREILEANIPTADYIKDFMDFSNAMVEGKHYPVEVQFNLPNGDIRYFRIDYKIIFDDANNPLFCIGKTSDIHDKKQLELLSQTDQLTQCYNKITTERLIKNTLLENPDKSHTIFIFDIDNFKSINDKLGHYFGDTVLNTVAEDLHARFKGGDILGRIGGDEFVLFLKNTNDMNTIVTKARLINQALTKSYTKENYDHKISGSIGIALYPQDGKTYEDLYKAADEALYQSKARGKDCYTFYSRDFANGCLKSFIPLETGDRMKNSYVDANMISIVYDTISQGLTQEETVQKLLEFIGEYLKVDRAYLLTSNQSATNYKVSYEWCSQFIGSQKDTQHYDKSQFAEFIEKIEKHDYIFSNDTSLEDVQKIYPLLQEEYIKSFAFVHSKSMNKPHIILSLDDCSSFRVWTEREMNSLKYINQLLSVYLYSHK